MRARTLGQHPLPIGDDPAPILALAQILAARAHGVQAGPHAHVLEAVPQRQRAVEGREVGVVDQPDAEHAPTDQQLEDPVVLLHQQRLAAGEIYLLYVGQARLHLRP